MGSIAVIIVRKLWRYEALRMGDSFKNSGQSVQTNWRMSSLMFLGIEYASVTWIRVKKHARNRYLTAFSLVAWMRSPCITSRLCQLLFITTNHYSLGRPIIWFLVFLSSECDLASPFMTWVIILPLMDWWFHFEAGCQPQRSAIRIPVNPRE